MHTACSIPVFSCSASARDGLVVSESLDVFLAVDVAAEAEGQIIAVALGGGAGAEGAEDDVCDALRGEDVAAYDGCFVRGGEEGFGWDEDSDGFETALVERDIFANETAETVDDCAIGYGLGGVGICLRVVSWRR